MKTYSELMKIEKYEERVEYLKLKQNKIGTETFGSNRYLNQKFYMSEEWKKVRNQVIVRDMGTELGMQNETYQIPGTIIVHHMNPITQNDILYNTSYALNTEYLICCSDSVHKLLHHGNIDEAKNIYSLNERVKNDTTPWLIERSK